jgi:hypothetical protein
LKQGPILFYNNTKLDFCNYNEVFVHLKENFAELGITNFVDVRETVRGKSSQELKDYGAEWVEPFAVEAPDVGSASTVDTMCNARLETTRDRSTSECSTLSRPRSASGTDS